MVRDNEYVRIIDGDYKGATGYINGITTRRKIKCELYLSKDTEKIKVYVENENIEIIEPFKVVRHG